MKNAEFQHVVTSWMRQCDGLPSWLCFSLSAAIATTLCLKWPTSFLEAAVRQSITGRSRPDLTQSCRVWAKQPKCGQSVSSAPRTALAALSWTIALICLCGMSHAFFSHLSQPVSNVYSCVVLCHFRGKQHTNTHLSQLVNKVDSHC